MGYKMKGLLHVLQGSPDTGKVTSELRALNSQSVFDDDVSLVELFFP